jgi:hypothetical protein
MAATAQATTKASWVPGTLYAIDGGERWLYYGQVAPDKYTIGFVRFRSSDLVDASEVLVHPLMCRVAVMRPSLGAALRAGRWKPLGKHQQHPDFFKPWGLVQCPVGTNHVRAEVRQDSPKRPSALIREWHTRNDDPEIQTFEVMAAWDAVHHLPARLKADYGQEVADWHVGGPLWRHRQVLQEFARRFPGQPGHQLPTD